jgi:hypothetical protein
MVVKTIEEIMSDYPTMLSHVGSVNPLLGKVNDYIGFGEQPLGTTYFKSRTDALASIKRMASNQVLKDSLVAKERKIIFRTDGRNYTPTEYLMFLVEKNAVAIIDNKINELENSTDRTSIVKLKKLYTLRENVSKFIDIPSETNKLKKSITRKEKYRLDLNTVNRLAKDSNLELFGSEDNVNYDYIGKLYNNAHLVVEKASGGHSVIERLRYTHKYRNLAKYKTYDEFNKIQWKWGFDTNAKTKGIAVNDAREWFDKGLIKINDKEILNEMIVFVINDKGQMSAVDGAHDDLVSAMWLAIQGVKSGYWYL